MKLSGNRFKADQSRRCLTGDGDTLGSPCFRSFGLTLKKKAG